MSAKHISVGVMLLAPHKAAGSPYSLPPAFLLLVNPNAPQTVPDKAKVPAKEPSFTRHQPREENDALRSSPAAEEGTAPGSCEVRWSSRYGRYLVTSRDVSAGEVLLQERPMLVVPKVGSETSCLSCMKPLKVEWTGCRRCGGPLCSVECRGSYHSGRECNLLQRMGFKQAPHIDALMKELNVIIGPLRLLLLVQGSTSAKDVFLCLESHAEKRKKLPIGKFVEEHIAGGLRQRLGLDLSSEIVHHLCGVLDTNAFDVGLDNSGRGRAVFAAAAMMNHSCVPNAQWWFSQGKMIVRAAVDIEKGRPVLINYTQTLWGTRVRGALLSGCKMFTCSCERCLDPTELGSHLSFVCCHTCHDVMQLPTDLHKDWECLTCGSSVASTTVEAMVRAGATTLSHLQEEAPAAVSATVQHLGRVLGPQHYIVAQAKQCFLEVIFRSQLSEVPAEHLEEAVSAAQQLTALLQVLEPGISRLKGLLLYYETAAATELLQRQGSGDKGAVQALLRQSREAERLLEYDRQLPLASALTASLETLRLGFLKD